MLPLLRSPAQAQPGWLSELWRTRRGRLFLVAGDSPLGFRLPLQSLPELDPVDYPHLVAADPFAEPQPLSDPRLTHPIKTQGTPASHGEEDVYKRQGKWYPGEPLPRWAFSLYWRRDGIPIWRDESLIAREAVEHDLTPHDSQRLAEGIAARIGIMADYVQPAYEDPTDRMLKQGLIPDNVDPSDPKIDDPRERARILSLFDGHLSEPAGFVLPLLRSPAQAQPVWLSELWRTRRGRLFLVAGEMCIRDRPYPTKTPFFVNGVAPIRPNARRYRQR